MKIITIIASVIAVLLIGFLIGVMNVDTPNILGGQADFYYDATNSSSSIPTTATTTNPILSLNTQRTNARICNNSEYFVFLHQKETATTTGVTVNEGIPLSPLGLTTSTENVCQDFLGFKGYLFGISEATSSVTVSWWE